MLSAPAERDLNMRISGARSVFMDCTAMFSGSKLVGTCCGRGGRR